MVEQRQNITADNFFTSIPLVTKLLAMKTTYTGTLKKNKAEIPREFLPAKTREVYSTLFDHTEKITLLSYVQKKCKCVKCVLSTMSHVRRITEEEDKKTQIILDYNKYNGGVDTMNHLATNYSHKKYQALAYDSN